MIDWLTCCGRSGTDVLLYSISSRIGSDLLFPLPFALPVVQKPTEEDGRERRGDGRELTPDCAGAPYKVWGKSGGRAGKMTALQRGLVDKWSGQKSEGETIGSSCVDSSSAGRLRKVDLDSPRGRLGTVGRRFFRRVLAWWVPGGGGLFPRSLRIIADLASMVPSRGGDGTGPLTLAQDGLYSRPQSGLTQMQQVIISVISGKSRGRSRRYTLLQGT